MRIPMRWIALVGVLFLVGCSSTSDQSLSSGGDANAGDSSDSSVAIEEAPAGAADSASRDSFTAGDTTVTSPDRDVITSGTVTMTVDDPRATAHEVSTYVEDAGGWVEARTEEAATDTTDASATLTIRVPASEVTGTLEHLETLGAIEDVSLSQQDVTMQVNDLDARIRARELSVERMLDLLSRAQTTDEVMTAEQMLTDRQSELESLLSEQTVLADQVAMSSLRVSIWEPDAVPPEAEEPPTGFFGGLVTGWNAFVSALQVTLLVIGVLLPWLVMAAGVAAVVVSIRRRNKRRQVAMGLPAASSTTTSPAPAASPPAHGAGASYAQPWASRTQSPRVVAQVPAPPPVASAPVAAVHDEPEAPAPSEEPPSTDVASETAAPAVPRTPRTPRAAPRAPRAAGAQRSPTTRTPKRREIPPAGI